jgi:predicted phosphate transport protein (TIGR00153 family)
MILSRLIPKETKYFSKFGQLAFHINEAAQALSAMLESEEGDFPAHVDHIKRIEHLSDELTHSVSTSLNQSFITPFDREDIYMLSGALDDIVDLIDDVARAMVMFDVRESTDYARRFAGVIIRMSEQLKEVVPMMEKPSAQLTPHLVEMHRLENEGDELYHAAIADLFRTSADPLTVIKWKDIYEKLEATIDRFENVSNIIESVIIKHT